MTPTQPPLSLLLKRWEEFQDRGVRVTPEQLCAGHPEWVEPFTRFLALIREMQSQPPTTGPRPADDAVNANHTPVCAGITPSTATGSVEADEALPEIRGYALQGVLGRGGMGIVYKAVDLALNREVAIKMMRTGLVSAEDVSRFQAEAEAVAHLRHEGIVQVYGRGQYGRQPFFVLEFCRGGSLANRLQHQPQQPRDAARLTAKLADAMHYAHTCGIVHRDLKPANVLLQCEDPSTLPVMVGPTNGPADASLETTQEVSGAAEPAATDFPDPTPKVTDFGLAKWIHRDSGLTQTVAIMGTPSYMAPEQAGGLSKQVGPAADVWSLGAILYECLTGKPPFQGQSIGETTHLAATTDPVPPRKSQKGIPGDLEVICLKCLRKQPTQRYGSAAELADDLRRFLRDEPIHARPVGPIERTWKWGRRNPTWAALGAVLTLFALVVPPVLVLYQSELNAAREVATERRVAAEKIEEASRTDRYFSCLDRAQKRQNAPVPGWSWQALGDVAEASLYPVQARNPAQLRTVAASALGSVDLRLHSEVARGVTSRAIAFSRDGKWLAIADALTKAQFACSVYLIDVSTGNWVRTFVVPTVPIFKFNGVTPDGFNRLAFSPDGRWLFAGTRGGRVIRWDLQHPKGALCGWVAHKDHFVCDLAVSADSKFVYSLGEDNVVCAWPVEGPRKLHASWSGGGILRRIAAHPAQPVLAVGGERGISLLDGSTLQQVADAPPRPQIRNAHCALAFDSTGGMLVVGCNRKLHLIDVEARLLGATFRDVDMAEGAHQATILDAAFSPDGALLASISSSEGVVKLWEVASGRLAATYFTGYTGALAFSPDGNFLAVSGEKAALLLKVRDRDVQSFVSVGPRPIQAMAATSGLFQQKPELVTLATQSIPQLDAVLAQGTPPEVRSPQDLWRYLATAVALATGQPVGAALATTPAPEKIPSEIDKLLDALERALPRLDALPRLGQVWCLARSACLLGEKSLDVSLASQRSEVERLGVERVRANILHQAVIPLRGQLKAGRQTWWMRPDTVLQLHGPNALPPANAQLASAWVMAENLDRSGRRHLWSANDLSEEGHYALFVQPSTRTVVLNAGKNHLFRLKLGSRVRAEPVAVADPRFLTLDPQGDTVWLAELHHSGVLRAYHLGPKQQAGPAWKNPDPAFKRTSGLHSLVAGRRHVLVGGQDGALRWLEPLAQEVRLKNVIPVGALPLTALALFDDDQQAVVGSQSGEVCLVDLASGRVSEYLPRQEGQITALAVDASGGLLATGSQNRTLELWQRTVGSWAHLFTLRFPSPVRQVAFGPDGNSLLVLLQRERAVRLWDLEKLRQKLHKMEPGLGW